MPPPHRTERRRGAVAAGLAGAALAACTVTGLAAGIPLATPAAASTVTARPAVAAPPVSVVINSVSPGYASPGHIVTVSGSVTDASMAPIPRLSIQLSLDSQPFSSRDALQSYASGGPGITTSAVPDATAPIHGALAPKATATWSVKLRPDRLRLTAFGVYALAAEAENSIGATLDTSRSFLPYWPGKGGLDPVRQKIAWIWPLIDQPRQSACPGLVNDGLAAGLASGGRLAVLLAAGQAYSSAAHLTWAIDPALLADARTMSSPYPVGDNGQCTGATRPADRAASSWLSKLKSATAGQPVFVTPYADVDAVGLVHGALNSDLTRAFTEGRSVAGQILGRDFAPAQTAAPPGDPDLLSGLAWPPNGIADYTTLQSLAGVDGISAVVLDSSAMPPLASWPPTPSAQTTTPDGEGPDLHVLLSDHVITSILGSASAASPTPGTGFAAQQYYLAETAMIAAEVPDLPRSIVVAPPSRWDPPASLARNLLAETVSAPWLRPVSLADLAAARSAPGQVSHRLAVPAGATKGGLSQSMLRQVRQLDQRVQLLQSIQTTPDVTLNYAVAATESAAWGGGAAGRTGRELVDQVSDYIADQESGLTLVGPPRVTLGGLKGTVPVSVANHLRYPVLVQLQVGVPRHGSISVRSQPGVLKVPGRTVITIKLAVSTAAVGSTTLRLSLVTKDGAPLPVTPVIMTVQATHYGTLALVIIAAALGVFMLTSAARGVRRGRAAQQAAAQAAGPSADGPSADGPSADGPSADGPSADGPSADGPSASEASGPAEPPPVAPEPPPHRTESPAEFAGQPPARAQQQPRRAGRPLQPGERAGRPGGSQKADNVESGRTERGPAGADDLEDADEYARTPGRPDRNRGRARP
jgi:hypothetical protein